MSSHFKTDIGIARVAFIMCVIMIFALPACAHGKGGPAAEMAMPSDAVPANEPENLKELNDVVLGLSGFEKRASGYSADEWNFVLGYAHFMHEKPVEAEHYLGKAAGKSGNLEDYVVFFRAGIANQTGDHAKAMGYLDDLGDNYPESVWSEDAMLERAIALTGLGRYAEAMKLIDDALESASDAKRGEIERLKARTYIRAGDRAKAISYTKQMALASGSDRDLEDLQGLFEELKSEFGFDAKKWLSSPGNQLRLAESFAADSQWSDAAPLLERLIKSGGLDSASHTRAKWLLAKSYRWTHRYGESIALMEDLKRSPGGRRIGGLNVTLATVYAKNNDYKKAIAIRRSILDGLPPTSRAASNMAYKIAFLYVDEDKYAEAIPLMRQVASMRSAGNKRILASWYVGWCHYMLKQYDSALASFDSLLKKGAKGARIDDRVMYWKGKVLLAMGRKGEASETFREVIRKYPQGYYAELARRRLSGDDRNLYDFAIAKGTWGGPRIWKPKGGNSLEGLPHMSRALRLDDLGLHSEVARELRAVDFNANPQMAEVGLWLAYNNYAHDIAYRLAKRTYRHALRSAPREDNFSYFVWEQAYPRAYDPVVTRLDSNGDIDPMLVWSIMKHESAFKPRVISPAGAVGLMQLMPTTANLMARERGDGKVSVRDLYRPGTNIAYGITYLDKLAGLFPGNAVAVIASYNAGEQAVGRWLANGT